MAHHLIIQPAQLQQARRWSAVAFFVLIFQLMGRLSPVCSC